MFRRLRQLCRALPCALLLALAAAPGYALAAAPPTAVVTMGDSYISGEAGRWFGNSANVAGSRDGTDRACVFTLGLCTSYDESRVYVDGGAATGCHRSDVAPVRSAQLPVSRRVNIACSGAVTTNLLRSSNGGTPARGEAPQADQLLSIARSTRIRMIVVSVGGNDLGFASIVTACFQAYLTRSARCSRTHAAALSDARLAGGDGEDRERDRRDPGRAARGRQRRYGLPARAADLPGGDPARGRRALRAGGSAANGRGLPVLRCRHGLGPGGGGTAHRQRRQGRRGLARRRGARAPARLRRPRDLRGDHERGLAARAAVAAELGVGPRGEREHGQGQIQELFHPNAYGQKALGTCLGALYAARRDSYACKNAESGGPGDMMLTALR